MFIVTPSQQRLDVVTPAGEYRVTIDVTYIEPPGQWLLVDGEQIVSGVMSNAPTIVQQGTWVHG